MKKNPNKKIATLQGQFTDIDKILLAFSGGVDSTFLLYLINSIDGPELEALTIKTPYIPQWEVDEAVSICSDIGVAHKILNMGIPDSIINNPADRCYLCKKMLFTRIREYAREYGFNKIVDGSNADDIGEYRPGIRALKELEIKSPLLEAGFTKKEIRMHSREVGLKIWDKPAYACLLTRLPHNILVDKEDLKTIELGEKYLHEAGFPGLRMRMHGEIARLECDPACFEGIINNRIKIISYLKNLGIKYITIDIEGYRTGSMNLI
ncbi:MAG TPA: ATP-dependent sacrificial sulfur transferase LarE [Bacteroidales bacterium]|nr:ATP-dependent sacrificial sulfur transferase LarE [Bacteroidales bacterium]